MKKVSLLCMLFIVALVAMVFPSLSMADTTASTVSPSTGSAGWDMALTVVLPLLVAASSIIANFFEVKPTDPPALVFVKRIINTLALNLSHKAGK